MSSKSLRPVKSSIFQGRIVAVDGARWTCSVSCEAIKRSFAEVAIPSLYASMSGEGIHYMPEIGTICYVCVPSDEGIPFLLMSAPSVSSSSKDGQPGSFHSNRPYLNPGDMVVLTKDGNGFIARRGGVTEFRGSALSRIVTNPFTNQIAAFAENWKVETFGGTSEWSTNFREESSYGELTCSLETTVREFVSSPSWSVRTIEGATDIRVELDGPVPAPPLVDTPVTLNVEGPLGTIIPSIVTIKKPATLDSAQAVLVVQVNSDETLPLPVPSASLAVSRAGDALITTAGKIRVVQEVDVGAAKSVLLGTDFLSRLSGVLEEIVEIASTSGSPTPETAALIAEIASGIHLSKTLEVE